MREFHKMTGLMREFHEMTGFTFDESIIGRGSTGLVT